MTTKQKIINGKAVKLKTVKCIVCGNSGIDLSLTDGNAVHRDCVENLNILLTGNDPELQKAKADSQLIIADFERLKAEEASFIGIFKGIFGGRDYSKEKAYLKKKVEASLDEVNIIKSKNELSDEEKKKKLALQKEIWDYWPTYPPDWDSRRDELLRERGGRCQKCKAVNNLHAHHKTPFWKGGSNTLENLELLCAKCHGDEHGRDFEKNGFGQKHTVVSDKEEMIAEAIKNASKITFMYKKRDPNTGRPQTRGSRRTIQPKVFKDFNSSRCVIGHCDLRNAERAFAIRRMYKVQLLD